jgi:hypothetical protein
MSLFILHPAREIVTALAAVMLLPVPVAMRVESNIFAPAPTRIVFALVPVVTKRQRRIVPVKVPPYESVFVIVQSVNVPVAVPPEELDPNPAPVTVHRKNAPDAVPPLCPPKLVAPAVQSVNVPDEV